MLETLLTQLPEILAQLEQMNKGSLFLIGLLFTGVGTLILYVLFYYILRPIFRKLEKDIAIVTVNVSANPAILGFALFSQKLILEKILPENIANIISHILVAMMAIIFSYWLSKIFNDVFIYYLKQYTKQTEAMWDDVLLPILSAIVPFLIYTFAAVLVISAFGIDLSGIWVALGGATFVLGFALQDILANFFSGIVLLIDSPFRFGDIMRLEDGSIGMLRKIGIRVTQLYIFSEHCEIYVPNSVLQGQNIVNLSRPTSFYHYSISLEIPSECNIEESQKLMEEIILAHPDTLGDIDTKIEVIDNYYNAENYDENVLKQQEIGKNRLLCEQSVNYKLEELQQALEALAVTMQFAGKGGLTAEEIENVQQEYQGALEIMGFKLIDDPNKNRVALNFEESNESEGLIELIRDWYRTWLQDPNLLDDDQYFISDEWERKINLLTRRAQRLSQKIANPEAEETRLDDYVLEFIQWLKENLKAPRKKWQEPKIRIIGMTYEESNVRIEFVLDFFVDDIKLEDGKRGDRVSSQIYQEIFRHFKETYLNWEGIKAAESEAD